MYTPTNTPIFGSLTSVTTIDLSLHTFLGVSWHILLPYTVFGIAIMIYSHVRLMRGQHDLKRANTQKRS